MNEPAMLLHASDQVQVFKERVRAASPDNVLKRPPDEDTGVSIAQANKSQVG